MNWNFIIRLLLILGILGYLIFTQLPMIVGFASSTLGIGIGMVLILFILLIFGIYKFLKAGLKKKPN